MYAAANRLLRGAKEARSSRNKQSSLPAVSPTMVAIAAAVLVAFIGGLYFITHHKKEEAEALQNRQVAGNGLETGGAGAISKSWKVASLAYVRLLNRRPAGSHETRAVDQ